MRGRGSGREGRGRLGSTRTAAACNQLGPAAASARRPARQRGAASERAAPHGSAQLPRRSHPASPRPRRPASPRRPRPATAPKLCRPSCAGPPVQSGAPLMTIPAPSLNPNGWLRSYDASNLVPSVSVPWQAAPGRRGRAGGVGGMRPGGAARGAAAMVARAAAAGTHQCDGGARRGSRHSPGSAPPQCHRFPPPRRSCLPSSAAGRQAAGEAQASAGGTAAGRAAAGRGWHLDGAQRRWGLWHAAWPMWRV